jgi:hypothetical protein
MRRSLRYCYPGQALVDGGVKTKKEEERDVDDDTTTKSAFRARQKWIFYQALYPDERSVAPRRSLDSGSGDCRNI